MWITGMVVAFAGLTAPAGFLLCDGSEVNTADYPDLYNIIGDAFGTPSAPGKFKLPDIRGRGVIGSGQGPSLSSRARGSSGGAETHTLVNNQLSIHSHALIEVLPSPLGGEIGVVKGNPSGSINTGPGGSGLPHPIMNPFVAMPWIIKA